MKLRTAYIYLSNENFDITKTLLGERFGNSHSVVDSHYINLVNMRPALNSTKGLCTLHDQFERHFRSLVALKQDTNQDVFVSIMKSKNSKGGSITSTTSKGSQGKVDSK